ncbi:MAG TPA: hypothetical protein VGP24_03935 [Glaciihabitans sp.]|jgi:hypothetical protein|nr:hypothetical protein [Glaciihabitans sp.]
MGKGILWTFISAVTVVALVAVFIITGGGSLPPAVCAGSVADAKAAASLPAVEGYSGDQLVNAAQIVNAGAAIGVDSRAQTIAVMTAMGESSLKNIDHGDVVGPDSRGLFQQRASWGTYADRMTPATAARFFYERLVKVPGWDTLAPTAAAHAVQRNADPGHYTAYYPAAQAVVAALSTGNSACGGTVISADAQQLAVALVEKLDAGKIAGLTPDHMKEIRWIAAGEVHENCGINLAVLQIITIAANTFERIGISDINRLCTNQFLGNPNSSHWANGGGHAVDFYSFNGIPTTGADPHALQLLGIVGPMMPEGSAVGQVQCRSTAGVALVLDGVDQFDDTCHHLHMQVASTNTAPLKAMVSP